MPEASTGGTGGRADTRSPAVPPGHARVDLGENFVLTFTTSVGTVVTDILRTQTLDMDGATYTTDNGYSFTVPRTWRFGDTIPQNDINFARGYTWRPSAGGRIDVTTFGDPVQRYVAGHRTYIAAASPQTDEQRRRERERQEQAEREYAEQIRRNQRELKAKHDRIDARAEETLRMVLRPDELRHYDKHNEIIVTGADRNRYRIDSGIVSNVVLLGGWRGNKDLASLCCHPTMWMGHGESLPNKDAHIAQILYLRHDLGRFWKKANVYWHDTEARDESYRGVDAQTIVRRLAERMSGVH